MLIAIVLGLALAVIAAGILLMVDRAGMVDRLRMLEQRQAREADAARLLEANLEREQRLRVRTERRLVALEIALREGEMPGRRSNEK